MKEAIRPTGEKDRDKSLGDQKDEKDADANKLNYKLIITNDELIVVVM